jgi:hypothetical protein
MEQKKSNDPIATRLNVLINLALEHLASEPSQSLASRIVRLSEMGVLSSDIADIVSKPTSYVAATLAQRKTKAKPKLKK